MIEECRAMPHTRDEDFNVSSPRSDDGVVTERPSGGFESAYWLRGGNQAMAGPRNAVVSALTALDVPTLETVHSA